MADQGISLQLKVRQNATEIGDFMNDLDKWENDIKKKDEDLKTSKTFLKKNLPPVRNQGRKKKLKKKEALPSQVKQAGEPKRINSYDYDSWSRFNVDEEMQKIDDNEEMETLTSSDEDDDTDDEQIEEERRLQKALLEKDKGNGLFKAGQYEEAINCYTTAIQLDPSNAIMPANRAMALLKVQRYGAAEEDCNTALTLDDTYTKAYLRRAATRFHLKKLDESLADYQRALTLEPDNKQAQQEIAKLQQMLEVNKGDITKDSSENTPKIESKKPLRRIHIDEIGSDSSEDENEGRSTESLNNNERLCSEERNKPQITEITSAAQDISLAETHTTELADKATSMAKRSAHAPSVNTASPKQRVFEVPQSSIQLQRDWKILRNDPEQLFGYLQKINPKSYPKLFQQSIDSDMLSTMITILHDYYIPANLPVINELNYLTQVQRFSMTAMFLSAADKKVLQKVFNYAKVNNDATNSTNESQLNSLMGKYGL